MIDWNKRLRMVNARHVQNPCVFKHTDAGNVIIEYEGRNNGAKYYTVVDKRTGKSFEPGGYSVENVPEEPKDTIALWTPARRGWTKGYSIDRVNGEQVRTRSAWEKTLGKDPQGIIFVKVPV